jgi:isoquinoline 1-oxidoreductase alpha subunit
MKLKINGKLLELSAPAEMPLLWVIRDIVGLTGTKYGCGAGLCGACTVHLDGVPVRSCSTPLEGLDGVEITTIEGLQNTKLKDAWQQENVAQCGYCQAGQLMSAAALLAEIKSPTDEDIEDAMAGNICRCGTYGRIKKAIRIASASKV